MSLISTFSVSLTQVNDTQVAAAKAHAAVTSSDVSVQVNIIGRNVFLENYNQAETGGTFVCTPGTSPSTSNEQKLGSLMSLLTDVFENGPAGWEESA